MLVRGFARNSAGTSDSARIAGPSSPVRVDTVLVVAGSTRPLPVGGLVADGLYHQASDKLYLSNITRNQLEVFYLGDSTFKAPVRVGSRPWGIAAWPRDRGDVTVPRFGQGDTILVANNGGTSISYVRVDIPAATTAARRCTAIRCRTSFVYTITAKLSEEHRPAPAGAHALRLQRPAAVAGRGVQRPDDAGRARATRSSPSTRRRRRSDRSCRSTRTTGTLRWENLTRAPSHFFWEQANGQGDRRADTLEIERFGVDGRVGDDRRSPRLAPGAVPPGRRRVLPATRRSSRNVVRIAGSASSATPPSSATPATSAGRSWAKAAARSAMMSRRMRARSGTTRRSG